MWHEEEEWPLGGRKAWVIIFPLLTSHLVYVGRSTDDCQNIRVTFILIKFTRTDTSLSHKISE